MPRFDAAWVAGMLGPERQAATPPALLLDLAHVRPGARVVDVGCGPGFLTLPAAERAGPHGTVLALDPEPRMLELVRERAREQRHANVLGVRASGEALPLAGATVDAAFCALVLHELSPSARATFTRELARSLRPDGWLLVVELTPAHDGPGNRLAPDATVDLLRAAGFLPEPAVTLGVLARSEGAEGLYAVAARRPAAQA